MEFLWPTLIFGAPVVAYFSAVFRYVPPPYKWVVERNLPTKPTKKIVWGSGLHVLWLPPPMMKIANKVFCGDITTIITVGKDDNLPGNPSKVEFSDTSAGVAVQLTTRVIDPLKATYEVDNYLQASANLVEASLRRICATLTLDQAMTEARDDANQTMLLELKELLEDWGVKVTNLALIDFMLSEETIALRDKILSAEKGKQAAITEAEGKASALKIEAASKAIATKLVATGEGKAEWIKINSMAQKLGLEPVQVMAYLLTGRMTDALNSSTIILSSGGEKGLQIPFADATATFNAIQKAMNKKSEGE